MTSTNTATTIKTFPERLLGVQSVPAPMIQCDTDYQDLANPPRWIGSGLTDWASPLGLPTPSMSTGPFGLTFIIGGTNVRFCLSLPGETTPQTAKVTWSELRGELSAELTASGTRWEDARELVLGAIARHAIRFVDSHRGTTVCTKPFDTLCSVTFSVAGPVSGEGIDATVSTTNTGVAFKAEPIARTMMAALNHELTSTGRGAVSCHNVEVLNDGAAGLKGEILQGALKGVDTGLFLIVGTGVGSMAVVDRALSTKLNEAGHRCIWNMATERYRFEHDLSNIQDPNGSFKQPTQPEVFAENVLAGPWAALEFMRYLRADERKAYYALVDSVTKKMESSASTVCVVDEMQRMLDLDYGEVTSWSAESSSEIIKCVNEVLFNPGTQDNWMSLDDIDPATRASGTGLHVLTVLARQRWELYCRDLGNFVGACYHEMAGDSSTPERIVIGGGIGELFNTYAPDIKERALSLMHETAKIPVGLVSFSSLDPVRREAAITQNCVDRTYECEG